MFSLFPRYSKLDRKYLAGLQKVNDNAVEVYKTSLHIDYDFPEMIGLGRVATVYHPCTEEKDKDFTTFLWDNGLTRVCYNELKPIDRCKIWAKYSANHVKIEPTTWGRFLKRRRRGLNKDFANAHSLILKEIGELNCMVRSMLDDILEKKTPESQIDFWDLIVRRDRIEDITSLYYALRRDLHEEGWDASVCTGELIGNDGSVSYSDLWMIDSGLWQVFDHYKVDPKQVMLKETYGRGWYPYVGKIDYARWWVKDWDKNYVCVVDLTDLDESDKKYFFGNLKVADPVRMSLEELETLFAEAEAEAEEEETS